MKTFIIGLILGALIGWGIFTAFSDETTQGGRPARPEEGDEPARRAESDSPPVSDGNVPPIVPGETPGSFAPGTAVLRIGDGYVFGRDRVSKAPGDIHCQDIRHGASLRCRHGTLPVDVPLGATGMPEKPADLAALVVDAPTDLPQRDAYLRSRSTEQDPGVSFVRAATGKTYKVWLVRAEHHPEALRRRVHLAYEEVPAKPGGGVARVASAEKIGADSPTQKDIKRIIAAGAAVPGDSMARHLSGAYVRLSEFPEKLDVKKERFLLVDTSLDTEVTFNRRGAIYAHGGIGPKGKVVLRSYAGVAVRGPMAGIIDVRSYGYVHIEGDLTGDLNINSYATVVIDGDIVGTLKVRSYTKLLLRGRILGKLDGAGSCWSTFYFDGYYSERDLTDLGGKFGSVTLHVRSSDLTIGKHEKIGSWRSVIVGDEVWKKLGR